MPVNGRFVANCRLWPFPTVRFRDMNQRDPMAGLGTLLPLSPLSPKSESGRATNPACPCETSPAPPSAAGF